MGEAADKKRRLSVNGSADEEGDVGATTAVRVAPGKVSDAITPSPTSACGSKVAEQAQPAPAADGHLQQWPHPRNHRVQFYDDSAFLCRSVGTFIASALNNDECALVVATPEHRAGVEQQLRALDVDISERQCRQQLTLLDAAQLLREFMVDGMPDRQRFFATVGSLVDRQLASWPRGLRIYGEMVNVLWAAGNAAATTALEALWNELAQPRPFTLLCGYALDRFAKHGHGSSFKTICGLHSHVLPSESFRSLPDAETQSRCIASLQQKALALQAEMAQHRVTELELRRREEQLVRREDELRQANDQLQRLNDELRRANAAAETAARDKTTFLQNISHELRTPLTAVVGFGELLLSTPNGTGSAAAAAARQEAATIVVRKGREMTRLLDDVLDLMQLESGGGAIERRRFSLPEFVAALSRRLAPMASARAIDLRVGFAADSMPPPRSIVGDPVRLSQVITSLASNAVEFTPPPNGSVEITLQLLPASPPSSTLGDGAGGASSSRSVMRTSSDAWKRENASLRVTVRDNGIGMASVQAERLFELFSQERGAVSSRQYGGGTGVGVYLAQQLAQRMAGDVVLVHTAPGSGSTFVATIDAGESYTACMWGHEPLLSLPDLGAGDDAEGPIGSVASDDLSSAGGRAIAAAAGADPTATVSILVVDDNETNRLLMRRLLERMGYSDVTAVADGHRAIDHASMQRCDIILIDVQMRGLDGYTTCQTIRQRCRERNRSPQPIVIAFTAHAAAGERERCLAAGMDDYVSKPIHFASLAEMLARWASQTLRNRPSCVS